MKNLLIVFLLFVSGVSAQIRYINEDTTWENETVKLKFINIENAKLTLINCKIDVTSSILGIGVVKIEGSTKLFVRDIPSHYINIIGDLSITPVSGQYNGTGDKFEPICYEFLDSAKTMLELRSKDGIKSVKIYSGRAKVEIYAKNYGGKELTLNLATLPNNLDYIAEVITEYSEKVVRFKFRR